MTNIAIIGSRRYEDLQQVRDYVASLPVDTVVVSGRGGNVDLTAEDAAKARGLATKIFPADWDTYGKSAGPRRNMDIIANCEMVVAFHDGASKGTLDTMQKAFRARPARRVVTYAPGESATWMDEKHR